MRLFLLTLISAIFIYSPNAIAIDNDFPETHSRTIVETIVKGEINAAFNMIYPFLQATQVEQEKVSQGYQSLQKIVGKPFAYEYISTTEIGPSLRLLKYVIKHELVPFIFEVMYYWNGKEWTITFFKLNTPDEVFKIDELCPEELTYSVKGSQPDKEMNSFFTMLLNGETSSAYNNLFSLMDKSIYPPEAPGNLAKEYASTIELLGEPSSVDSLSGFTFGESIMVLCHGINTETRPIYTMTIFYKAHDTWAIVGFSNSDDEIFY